MIILFIMSFLIVSVLRLVEKIQRRKLEKGHFSNKKNQDLLCQNLIV